MPRNNNNSDRKTGCEVKHYTNGDNEQKHFYYAWHNSKLGKVTCKMTPMTPEGARNLAEAKGYDKSYSNITSSGNKRYFYELEFRVKDSLEIKRKRGICSLNKRGQFFINSMNMVANHKKNSFTTL